MNTRITTLDRLRLVLIHGLAILSLGTSALADAGQPGATPETPPAQGAFDPQAWAQLFAQMNARTGYRAQAPTAVPGFVTPPPPFGGLPFPGTNPMGAIPGAAGNPMGMIPRMPGGAGNPMAMMPPMPGGAGNPMAMMPPMPGGAGNPMAMMPPMPGGAGNPMAMMPPMMGGAGNPMAMMPP